MGFEVCDAKNAKFLLVRTKLPKAGRNERYLLPLKQEV
jgi:hypothetical protein